jgi:hypothetical protein
MVDAGDDFGAEAAGESIARQRGGVPERGHPCFA